MAHAFCLLDNQVYKNTHSEHVIKVKVKVKWSRYGSGVTQRVGRGIALLSHDRGTRRGWVVSSTPRPHFTPGKNPVSILQEAEWVLGRVWTGGKSPSEHVILTAFLRQEWLRERASMLRWYVPCLSFPYIPCLANLIFCDCMILLLSEVHISKRPPYCYKVLQCDEFKLVKVRLD